jgi:cytoplasmic iron level regulating protein YaaA (DUF328/UPF0246 family)
MFIVISPAKTLDFDTPVSSSKHTFPAFLDDSAELVDQLRELEPGDFQELMGISEKLAVLNSNRYQEWSTPFDTNNARQSILAFKGDVYTGLEAETMTKQELDYAQKHLRILSGLYGVLRPLDLMQPYRLEMGTKFKNDRGNDLYEFWGESLTTFLNRDLKKQKENTIINLASNEYFQSLQVDKLKATIITPKFKEKHKGTYRFMSFYAKKARGLMSRYIISNKISDPNKIKDFDVEGYRFNEELSDDLNWIFTRNKPA